MYVNIYVCMFLCMYVRIYVCAREKGRVCAVSYLAAT